MSDLPTFSVNETTLVFAFRYALGRRSTAPGHMVAELKRHWKGLNDWTQRQIHEEIERAVERSGQVGSPTEPSTYDPWCEVLTWPRKTDS